MSIIESLLIKILCFICYILYIYIILICRSWNESPDSRKNPSRTFRIKKTAILIDYSRNWSVSSKHVLGRFKISIRNRVLEYIICFSRTSVRKSISLTILIISLRINIILSLSIIHIIEVASTKFAVLLWYKSSNSLKIVLA